MTTAHEQAETAGHSDCQGECACYRRGHEAGAEAQAEIIDSIQNRRTQQLQQRDRLQAEINADQARYEERLRHRNWDMQDALRDLESARERGDSWDEGRALNKLRRLS